MIFQALQNLRHDHLRIAHGLEFYPYQNIVSDRILIALLRNLNIRSEADIKNLELAELAIEFSRQSGKTTAIVHTAELIMTFVAEIYGRPINIGLFAPQIEQARTDFERLKNALRPIKGIMITDEEQQQRVKERENAKTLVLPNGSSCWIAPVTTTSKPESKTFDIMLFEEAQDMNDKIVKEQIWPIGATTNSPRIYIGSAGTQICYFRDLGLSKDSIKLYFDEIVKQRRQHYEKTKDPKHLIYEQTVRQEIAKHGLESDEIQRPYFGKWLIGTGQFTTEEELAKLYEKRDVEVTKDGECYVGIDTAKHPDSTVVTVVHYKDKKRKLINWLELRGENYKDQFDIILGYIKQFNVVAVAIDSTGQGDFMPDLFVNETIWQDEDTGLYRVKFSMQSKDLLYRNLKGTIQQQLTTLPISSINEADRFKSQLLNLQQQYKGQFLSVQHPDNPTAHDDFCFVGTTLIKTSKGDKPIQDIVIGDMVWTRAGFKPVIAMGNRKAEVISRFGLTGTPNHPFITKTGAKPFNKLQLSDTIYTWNERLSNIEASSITAIPSHPEGNSGFTTGHIQSGKHRLNRYIGKSTQTIMALYQKALSYITKTTTHSTIPQPILSLSNGAFISQGINQHQKPRSEPERIWRSTPDQKQFFGTSPKLGETGTENTLTKASSNTNRYQTVYNISVADQPEYLANGVLVHNCDSWALAEWAWARWNEETVGIASLDFKEAKKVKHEAEATDTGLDSDEWI